MSIDLTNGPVTKKMMLFSLPLIAGNLLQQTYNIADTVIVGRFLGADALAAVGSSYTLMTFLTSILLGLCMGSGALFSIRYGEKNEEKLKESIGTSFLMIAAVALLLNVLVCRNTEWILEFLQVPQQVYDGMRTYLEVVFTGIFATFLYNYFASLLRAAGESLIPLIFLAVCCPVLNIVLDLWFVIGLDAGIAGACSCNCNLSVDFRNWDRSLHLGKMSAVSSEKERFQNYKRDVWRDFSVFVFNLCSAVCYESGDFDGAGAGKQLRAGCNGGICSSCEDRFICIYAGAGFRQCVFHFCGTELRGRKTGADPGGGKKVGAARTGILSGDLSVSFCVCKAAAFDFCPAIRNRNSGSWNSILAD